MRPLTCVLLTALLAIGCGQSQSSDTIPVGGTVTLDGKPLAKAVLTFVPQGNIMGTGGGGTTDSAGKYQVLSQRGEKGLLPGLYKVIISCQVLPEGMVAPPGVPPIDLPLREILPAQYTDMEKTTLTAKVAAGSPPIDFALKSDKKR
jgi:hypothetical protein